MTLRRLAISESKRYRRGRRILRLQGDGDETYEASEDYWSEITDGITEMLSSDTTLSAAVIMFNAGVVNATHAERCNCGSVTTDGITEMPTSDTTLRVAGII